MPKKTATDALKTTSKRAIQNTAKGADGLMGKNITDKIKRASRILPKNSSETVTSEAKNTGINREIPKEKYISPEKRKKNIDDLRLI